MTQIGWLYPLAGAALVFGFVGRFRRRARTDRLGTGLVLWAGWLATVMAVFSKIDIPHTAYMAALAPPLSALSGLGVVEFWREYRRGGRTAWLLPAVVGGQAGWSVYLARSYSGFLPWISPTVIVVGAVAVAALVAGLVVRRAPQTGDVAGRLPGIGFVRRRGLRLAVTAAVTGVVAMLLMPTAWSLSAFNRAYDGTAFDASAGPIGGRGLVGTATLSASEQQLLSFVDARKGSARYVMATTSWSTAAPYIAATGQMVMPMGGFSGSVPQPTLAAFQNLVHTGQVKFVLVGGGFGFGGGGGLGGAGSLASITQWVQGACTSVPATDYSNGDAGGGALYQCGT